MAERAREMKAEARASKDRAAGESDLLAKIDAMPEAEQALARRVHALVTECAPALVPKTWYGMPAWARDGKIVCFFQSAQKFSTRYATLGFTDAAALDDGALWPVAFALAALGEREEATLRALIARV